MRYTDWMEMAGNSIRRTAVEHRVPTNNSLRRRGKDIYIMVRREVVHPYNPHEEQVDGLSNARLRQSQRITPISYYTWSFLKGVQPLSGPATPLSSFSFM